MSIWNLPLAVDMPEVRTPTPAALAALGVLRARPSSRYSLTVSDAANDLSHEPGCEEVRSCAVCGGASSDSILGAAGWRVLRRCGAKSVSFCPDCYREAAPVRVAAAGHYADARSLYQAAQALATAQPYCPDARAALAVAGVVLGLARHEWLDAEQEGGTRKAG